MLTGIVVAAWSLIGDAGETYDLTNIGTLFAFVLVCIGVIVLRYTDPDASTSLPRAVCPCRGHPGCGAVRVRHERTPGLAWVRFGWWLVIGLVLYFLYGYRNSTLRRGTGPVVVETSH